MLTIKYLFKILLIINFLFGVFWSCSNDEENLSLGSEFVEKSSNVIEIDTFFVELSTVLIDSIKTSNFEKVLVGKIDDSELGKITAKSYIQFSPSLPFNAEQDDLFDSLTLVLPYSTYSYGDTNIIQHIQIYRLNESLEFSSDENSYYNISELSTYTTPICSYSYYPRPNRDTVIEIRLSDELGRDFLYKAQTEATEFSTVIDFQDYFYGIVITDGGLQSNSMIGFNNNSDLKMILYSTRVEEEAVEIINEFSSSNLSYQFNQIKGDRTNTLLNNLITQKEELNSIYTDNKSYLQCGTGILTKVRFPYFSTILFDEDDIVLKAELILKPTKECYKTGFPNLIYYTTNKYNEFVSIALDESGYAVAAEFSLDELYHEDTYYSFNITDFIKNELEDDYFDNSKGLLIAIPSPDFNTTIDRMIIHGNDEYKNRPILKLTYLKN